jgi:hypothetical protein
MTSITHSQILDAVKDTLSANLLISGVLQRAQSAGAGEITDDIPETPLMQVYWVGTDPDDQSMTAKSSFGKSTPLPSAIHRTRVDVNVYIYVQQRNHLGQDLQYVLEVADEVYNLLEKQERVPFFGLDGLNHLDWRVEYATLAYGAPERRYAGMLFTLNLWVF